ncbi:MAG: hypothetical protein JNK45_12485, partial [Myxococcales bacterium]|nr:hypothetical protein [Myxococcales bacterium]
MPALHVELICHPQRPCAVSLAIGVSVERDAGQLALAYVLRGITIDLRIPTP